MNTALVYTNEASLQYNRVLPNLFTKKLASRQYQGYTGEDALNIGKYDINLLNTIFRLATTSLLQV